MCYTCLGRLLQIWFVLSFIEGKFGGSFWTYGGGLDSWFYCEQGGIVLVVVVVVVVVIGVGYSA